MRLLSANVRNYRIHRDTSVEFAPDLTLIGGPNAAGKSTLAEAIHRALFLKSTIGGEIHDEIQSTLHTGGHPEVEVRFEAAGKTWRLTKLFAKNSGKTTLAEEGGATLRDADAEARLAALLGVEEAEGGKGGANKTRSQWAHLWVWQGSGGDDPSEHAAPQKDALISRLEEQGGGAAMQSELDARVAAKFQQDYDAIFTGGGKPKTGSPLQKAAKELGDAEAALAEAEAAFAKLESADRDFRAAESTLASGDKKLAELDRELTAYREREKQAVELCHQVEKTKSAAETASSAAGRYRETLEKAGRLADEVKRLSEAAKKSPVSAAEESARRAKKIADEASRTAEKLEEERTAALTRRELAEAWGHLLKNRERLTELRATEKVVGKLRTNRKEIDEELARLPAIDEKTYRTLQTSDESAAKTEAVLEAMSTGIEILEAKSPVTVGDESLGKGETRVLDRDTTVETADGTKLEIRPGGGSSLEEARSASRAARTARDEAFQKAGVETLSQAGEIRARRSAKQSEREELGLALARNQADSLADEIDAASREAARYDEETKRLAERSPGFSPPETSDDARALYQSVRDGLAPLETRLSQARGQRDDARRQSEEAQTALEAARQTDRENETSLIAKKAELKAISEPLGPESERTERLAELEEAKQKANTAHADSQEKLASLQPDAVADDVDRCERALEGHRNALSAARESRAAAESLLRSDGTLDPTARLATTRARAESADERYRSLARRADAIRLLRDRFASEQQSLSEQFSQPLADKVSGYLQLILGPGTSVGVSVDDGTIGDWTLTHGGETFPFPVLSGGTREQVAAAVRLAMAELLASDYGGHLPIVFDDAFTNTDPERLRCLHRMLDLAARNGVQVIVLTCAPEDYAGLGAKTEKLTAPTS